MSAVAVFIFVVIPTSVMFFCVGWAAGYSRGKAPKPYVPPVTYTVLGYHTNNVVEDLTRPKETFVYVKTTIRLLSSEGEMITKTYHGVGLNAKQVERIALENDWFCDPEVLEKKMTSGYK